MTAVEVSNLTVLRGGRPVLCDVGFRIAAGELVGLVGPSGSGKTTLMRAIVGVQREVHGGLAVLGRAAGHHSLRSRVGYVTQRPSVYADLTVRENLTFFASLVSAGPDVVDAVVGDVDLRDVVDRRVERLSGGQQARVSLATALLGSPDLLVLDEPTVGLDPVLREDLWNMFRALAHAGRIVLVSSHVMDEAARCDRVLLLRDGRVLADASPEELLRRTDATDLDAAFLRLVRDREARS